MNTENTGKLAKTRRKPHDRQLSSVPSLAKEESSMLTDCKLTEPCKLISKSPSGMAPDSGLVRTVSPLFQEPSSATQFQAAASTTKLGFSTVKEDTENEVTVDITKTIK